MPGLCLNDSFEWIILIGKYRGGPEEVKARLAEVLQLSAGGKSPKHFEALWRSMDSRVQAVTDANGWYTPYSHYAVGISFVFLLLNALAVRRSPSPPR